MHERERFLHRFKLVMQICHIDQQKTAWFESDSIDTKQWTLFACEIWVIWLHLNEEMIWITDLSTLDELLCGGLLVVLGPAPGVQGRGLQGTSIREGEGPGFVQRAGVDGVQVDGRLLLTLTSREESHTCQENGTVISPHNVHCSHLLKTWCFQKKLRYCALRILKYPATSFFRPQNQWIKQLVVSL